MKKNTVDVQLCKKFNKYNHHHYFGKWFERYKPTLHDAIMGPVDSFNPICYDETRTGECFLRIDVGVLEKPDEPRYTFATSYKILNGGSWKVKKKSSSVACTHELNNGKASLRLHENPLPSRR